MSIKRILTYTLYLFAITLLAIPAAHARVDILPRKIVIEPRERGAELTVLNLYDQPSLYRVSLLNYRQNEDGSYETLDHPLSEAFDPAKTIRFSPKQFTVEPGGRQKIRLSLRKPANLPEGEYRFHLLATRFPTKDNQPENTKGIQLNMTMNVGVAIPIVVRHGQLSVEAAIDSAQILPPSQTKRNRPELLTTISRTGNSSAVGKLTIMLETPGQSARKIGYIDNMNIFTELDRRTIAVPLSELPTPQDSVKIIYKDDNGNIFDEKTIQP